MPLISLDATNSGERLLHFIPPDGLACESLNIGIIWRAIHGTYIAHFDRVCRSKIVERTAWIVHTAAGRLDGGFAETGGKNRKRAKNGG